MPCEFVYFILIQLISFVKRSPVGDQPNSHRSCVYLGITKSRWTSQYDKSLKKIQNRCCKIQASFSSERRKTLEGNKRQLVKEAEREPQ